MWKTRCGRDAPGTNAVATLSSTFSFVLPNAMLYVD